MSSTEYNVEMLNERVALLEEVVNKVQQVLVNCVSVDTLHQLVLIRQKEITVLQEQVVALQNEINLLKAEVFK